MHDFQLNSHLVELLKKDRRYYKMWVKIVCFILLVPTGINLAAAGGSKNGSGEECCERVSKGENLGQGICIL